LIGAVPELEASTGAPSLPELIILRQVPTLRLIAFFVGILGSGVLAVGFLFNLIF
jgi:hypothetical protein